MQLTNFWQFAVSDYRASRIPRKIVSTNTVTLQIWKSAMIPSYPKFIASKDHRADTAHWIINTQIQHLPDERAAIPRRRKLRSL